MTRTKSNPAYAFLVIFIFLASSYSAVAGGAHDIHVWEMQEIVLKAQGEYANYYTDVTCWLELTGPGFSKKIYGFWNGGKDFVFRIVATEPGKWHWTSGSNKSGDRGLNNISGDFTAVDWTEKEKEQNPNRRGFIRPVPDGHSLQYADGTPFFLIGDTWLAAATWRLPLRGVESADSYLPGPGIGFEDALNYRKRQGYNSVSMIASFPNWDSDCKPATYADSNGIYVRNAWEKFGYTVDGGKETSKDMRDEYGNRPFEMSVHPGVADFDRIKPEYFKSLDKKMQYLSDRGFVPLIETVRRDMCPSWKAYFNFNESFARYVQYIISRYGAYNIIFSGIHLDWIPKEYSLTGDEFNEALTYHLKKYGPLPFGQPYTTLISSSTYSVFGHGKQCPWLTMHSVGNKPRDHRVADSIEILFNLVPPYPAVNFEPYYTGWDHEINMPNGERPKANSARDNYFARAQMYGSVLSGGLSGHVHGTGAYDITTTGEPAGARPHFWDAMKYESGSYMQYLERFILTEGKKYQQLRPASGDIHPRKAPGSPEKGLDGWSYMMRTPGKELALLYFENRSVLPELAGFRSGADYCLRWFTPSDGNWGIEIRTRADKEGKIVLEGFPDGQNPSIADWGLKIDMCDDRK